MCIVLVAWRTCPGAPLVLAANRDEYHERPTRAAGVWDDAPSILGGRDLEQGGSWLAVDGGGRMAAVTNYREPEPRRSGARSRGLLVSDYLRGSAGPAEYLRGIAARAGDYDAFNLLIGDRDGLWFLGNCVPEPMALGPGIYGISNGDLDCPWPKVTRGRAELQRVLSRNSVVSPQAVDSLFSLLANRDVPADHELPDTGVGPEWERRLAPLFVQAGAYGTRSSTVLFQDDHGRFRFHERCFDSQGNVCGAASHEIGA